MGKTGANRKVTGEPWFACAICGFDFPYAERMRHYKTGLLVDSRCMDEPTHHDYLTEWNPYDTEYERISEQPVQDQGPAPGIDDLIAWGGPTKWRTGKWLHVELEGPPPQPEPIPPSPEIEMFNAIWTFVTQITEPPSNGEIRNGGAGLYYIAKRDKDGFSRAPELDLVTLPQRFMFRDNDGNVATFDVVLKTDMGTYYTLQLVALSGDIGTVSREDILLSWYAPLPG